MYIKPRINVAMLNQCVSTFVFNVKDKKLMHDKVFVLCIILHHLRVENVYCSPSSVQHLSHGSAFLINYAYHRQPGFLWSVLQFLVRKQQLRVRRKALHFPLLNTPLFPSSQTRPLLWMLSACLLLSHCLAAWLCVGVRPLEAAQAPCQEGCIVLQNLICHYVMLGVNWRVTLAFHLPMCTCRAGGGGAAKPQIGQN